MERAQNHGPRKNLIHISFIIKFADHEEQANMIRFFY